MAIGMTELFKGMDASLLDDLKAEWEKILKNDEPYLKKEVLLSLKKDYKTIDEMVKAGYSKEMLDNAIIVLKNDGYEVDLENGIIKK